jgi:hypothetical protein
VHRHISYFTHLHPPRQHAALRAKHREAEVTPLTPCCLAQSPETHNEVLGFHVLTFRVRFEAGKTGRAEHVRSFDVSEREDAAQGLLMVLKKVPRSFS